jgi:diadenosine tetraphosphate (Ap4A) HIT family hydrolase
MTCAACESIERIRRGGNDSFIAELSESYAVLADEQFYEGWCVLLIKDHQEHLAQLPRERSVRLWQDVTRVAEAMTRQLRPVRINYECLGNQLHHIHWHIVPRYATDPDPTSPIWLCPPEQRRGNVSAQRRAELIATLRAAI